MKSVGDSETFDDITDAFDAIAMAETRFTEQGHNEGINDTVSSAEEIRRGFSIGVDMAAAIATEVGCHWGFATIWLERLKKQSSQRKLKVLQQLRDTGDEIINTNVRDEKWDEQFESARSKYKQAKVVVGVREKPQKLQPDLSF